MEFEHKSLVDNPHQNRWNVGDWSDDSDQTILILISLTENKGEVSISLTVNRGEVSISLPKNLLSYLSISLVENRGEVSISYEIGLSYSSRTREK